MTAVAIAHRDKIIAEVSAGKLLDDIASDVGIAAPNISKHLATDPDYRQARQIGAQLRLERAYSLLAECGKDAASAANGNLVRARDALWRASAWFAEREFPDAYGQRVTAQVDASLTVHVVRLGVERAIEGECVKTTPELPKE